MAEPGSAAEKAMAVQSVTMEELSEPSEFWPAEINASAAGMLKLGRLTFPPPPLGGGFCAGVVVAVVVASVIVIEAVGKYFGWTPTANVPVALIINMAWPFESTVDVASSIKLYGGPEL